ncbi:restriction endonuclease subunit S [Kangiella sp.]|uniref:restriction endonuclease subunit S n=1 Tax=Kangiella sp. TaxID=1920245 RepID=UPI0019CB690F|nr:restriction endonuclease subunit S [Kangiella sp.]MBD3654279.1 restriction endonuclease subunit S [Kangiella sp.]
MVPEGWETGQVRDLVESLDAGVSVNSEDDGNTCAPYKILKTSCVSSGVFKENETKSVLDDNEINRLKEPVINDSIIISRMNTPALVGANGYVEHAPKNTFLPDRLWQAKPKKEKVEMRWLAYWFGSSHTRYILSSLGTGTSGSMKNITKGDVLNSKILIPPVPEQKKIAQILSTWDKAITTTEKLLKNSQQQKKALMQQLLTGKKRLLDDNGVRFNGEWRKCRIEEYFDVGSSKRVLQEDWKNKGVPFYRTRELVSLSKNEKFRSEIFISEDLFLGLSEKYGVPSEGDFLISGVGTLGISYQVKHGDRFYFKDGNVLWLKKRPGVNSDFFKYSFDSKYVQNQIKAQASITTVGTYTITNARKTKFLCPPTLSEQEKISEVMNACDDEILMIQLKLKKLKKEKKALMQQLLTGKRRVKLD